MVCWSWNSNTLATWCEELTHLKRPWCWERLKVGGEGDDRGWDGWMASLTQWTWVWVSSRSWWWTGRPGVLRFMGSQRVGHDWATELNWTELNLFIRVSLCIKLHERFPRLCTLMCHLNTLHLLMLLYFFSWYQILVLFYISSRRTENLLCLAL